MSHESSFSLQLPVVRPCPGQFKTSPLPLADLRVQPSLQQEADEAFRETNRLIQEPRPTAYPVQQSLDSILEILHQEIGRHNETRLILQTSRKTNLQLEQLLFQERTFNHSLRVSVQEAEIKRVIAEGKLQANENQNKMSPQSTPLSDYKSATLSPILPDIRDVISATSERKRKEYPTTSLPYSSRLRSKTSSMAPKSAKEELERDSAEESDCYSSEFSLAV